jgi:hypothetical protein
MPPDTSRFLSQNFTSRRCIFNKKPATKSLAWQRRNGNVESSGIELNKKQAPTQVGPRGQAKIKVTACQVRPGQARSGCVPGHRIAGIAGIAGNHRRYIPYVAVYVI